MNQLPNSRVIWHEPCLKDSEFESASKQMNTSQKRIPIFEFGEVKLEPAILRSKQFETDHPAAIPKLPLPTQTMKMNNTICERGSTESQRPFSARRTLHHVTFFCDTPGAE